MAEINGIDTSRDFPRDPLRSLIQSCLARFDALVAEEEIFFDKGTTTIISVTDTFKVSFRLCPQLLSKPVIVSSPTTSTFPDPLAARARNPFEDPDPRYVVECPILTQGGASPTHRLLINKFPVYRPQLLVTTVAFKSQADDLDIDDWRAGLGVLAELQHVGGDGERDGREGYMGIYNCGANSGNSQSHKHLQLFPKPGADEIELLPELTGSKDTWRTYNLAKTDFDTSPSPSAGSAVYSDPEVPFVHFFAFFPYSGCQINVEYKNGGTFEPVSEAAAALATYSNLLLCNKRALEIAGVEGRASYNVVFTRQWMLVIPRRAACGAGTGSFRQGPQVNAAGMAGMVWMSNARELEEWRRRGVAAHLGECGLRWKEMHGTELEL